MTQRVYVDETAVAMTRLPRYARNDNAGTHENWVQKVGWVVRPAPVD